VTSPKSKELGVLALGDLPHHPPTLLLLARSSTSWRTQPQNIRLQLASFAKDDGNVAALLPSRSSHRAAARCNRDEESMEAEPRGEEEIGGGGSRGHGG
jgi:hypothetical protein